ncbi:transposase [Corynebacterium sp. zg254]|uniref:transposase n=1 Tax=Corynebacterium TaxID=1716 RepID=UPI0035B5487D
MFIVSGQQRKRYTPEFRREAEHLVIEPGKPIAHVAAEIGVGAGLLGTWVTVERERIGSDFYRKPPPSSLRSNAIGKVRTDASRRRLTTVLTGWRAF